MAHEDTTDADLTRAIIEMIEAAGYLVESHRWAASSGGRVVMVARAHEGREVQAAVNGDGVDDRAVYRCAVLLAEMCGMDVWE